jgi:glutathione S-transferase
MAEATIIIGNKNYSSWSFRGWLIARHAGLALREILIPLGRPETRAEILQHSPSGRVPCLIHGGTKVWETLSIGEYLAEAFPDSGLWPRDRAARIHARNISNEMHAGFPTLRTSMPMNVRATLPGKGRRGNVALLDRDIERIGAIWRETRETYGRRSAGDEGYLFGSFTIADAMFAPVVSRFHTYGVRLDATCDEYVARMLKNAHVADWFEASRREPLDMPDKNL